MAAIFKGQSLVDAGMTNDVIATMKDIRVAANAFKQKYRYLPGDFPLDTTTPEISGFTPTSICVTGDAAHARGDGNGLISLLESPCATEQLIRAEFIKGDPTVPIWTRYGSVSLVRAPDSGAQAAYQAAVPNAVQNVMVLTNITCNMALDIDRKLDDGDLLMGTIRASKDNVFCTTEGNEKFPLPAFSMAL
jgi:hypothetical protein